MIKFPLRSDRWKSCASCCKSDVTYIDLTYSYRIRELVPGGAEVPIRGSLELTLPNTVITNGSSSEQVTYTIWVQDQAGHESNRISAGPITVIAQ